MRYLAQHGGSFGYQGGGDDFVLPDGLDVYNIADYGAVSGGPSNVAAMIAAYTAAFANTNGGIVWVPAGEWFCPVNSLSTSVFLLTGSNKGKVIFAGEGRASHLLMSGNGGSADKRVFDIKNSANYIGFRNLAMDSVLTNETEQQHLIHWENGGASVDPETGRGFIVDCYFEHTRGDCVRVLGNDTRRVAQIVIKRCVGEFTGAVRTRTLFSFQRAADNVVLDACYGDGAGNSGSIDMEPTGVGSNVGNMFLGLHLVGQPSLTGNGLNNEHEKSIMASCTILGSVDGLDVENLTVTGCIVQNNQALVGVGAFALFERIHNVAITDNILFNGVGGLGSECPLAIFNHSVGENHGLVVDGNMVVNDCNNASGSGANMQYVSRTTFSNNLISVKVSSSGIGVRFEVPTLAETYGDIVCCGNMVLSKNAVLTYGVTVGQGDFSVMQCLFRTCVSGVTIVGTRIGEYMATQNVMISTSNGLRILDTSYVAIGGAGNSKGPTTYHVVADAEGLVAALPGSIALRSTGGIAGQVMKVKELNVTPTTGWIGK